ncbi:MAG: hypothetical protein WC082_08475 [Victivallales bacterium]|jgi:hypothetical protein
MKTVETIYLAIVLLSGQLLFAEAGGKAVSSRKGFDKLKIVDGQWDTSSKETLISSGSGRALMGEKDWENYIFEATCTVTKTSLTFPWPGLIVRYRNGANYLLLTFSPREHYWYIIERLNGRNKRLAGGLAPIKMESAHRLKLFCYDNDIRFYVDGKEVGRAEASGGNYCGKVGFSGTRKTTTIFSDPIIEYGDIAVTDEADKIAQLELDTRLSYHDGCRIDNPPGRILVTTARDINVGETDQISVNVKGDGYRHILGVVLTDNHGEKHFVGRRIIRNGKEKKFVFDLKPFFKSPVLGEVTGLSWDGDGNQKIDFPLKKIELSLFNKVAAVKDSSGVEVGKVIFYFSPKK